MPWPLTVRCLTLALVLSTSACGSSSRPTGPSEPAGLLEGSWTGTLTHEEGGEGALRLVLRHVGPGATGTFSIDLPGTVFDAVGSVSGTVSGSRVFLGLTPAVPVACPDGLVLSRTMTGTGSIQGDRLTATLVELTCDGASTVEMEVQRAR